jgi:uncharacterized protein (TIGR00266 family)
VIPAQNISTQLLGSNSFRLLKANLAPGQTITVEPGLMASQSTNLFCKTEMNGNFLKALASKFFGGESFFINHYTNTSSTPAELYITQSTPGDMFEKQLNGEAIFIEAGGFLARTSGVNCETVWAGFVSFFGGEGLFRLKYSGYGTLWFGSYGAVFEKEIDGSLIVDSGHLVAYPPNISLSLKLAGSIFSSILSKEGFVLKLTGKGKVILQTRSVKGLASWLNTRFWR